MVSSRDAPRSSRQLPLGKLLRAGTSSLSAELRRTDATELPAGLSDRLARLLGDRLPCAGVLHLRCPGCDLRRDVRFRCMGGCALCPNRADRRARALARLIPRVPVRHWVLSLPPWLRAYLARDDVLTAQVARLFMRELFELMRRETNMPARIAHCGGVSLVHRAGTALNVNVHVHALMLDGVYTVGSGQASATFHPLATPPSSERADALVRRVLAEVRVLLRRRMEAGAVPMSRSALARLHAASVRHNVATGPRAGSSVRRVRARVQPADRKASSRAPAVSSRREGATLHGGPRVEADARHSVLRLSRYLTRPPVDLGAIEPAPGDKIRYALPRPLHDGTTHVEMSPQELAEKLVALVPRGTGHRVAYHGVLAPRAAHRWRVLPTQLMLVEADTATPTARRTEAERNVPAPGSTRSLLHCQSCDRPMQVVAVDEDGAE